MGGRVDNALLSLALPSSPLRHCPQLTGSSQICKAACVENNSENTRFLPFGTHQGNIPLCTPLNHDILLWKRMYVTLHSSRSYGSVRELQIHKPW